MPFQLTILGSGSATPTLQRNPTAQILQVESDYYLIDCGEGTQTQILRYKLRPGRLKYIFISHLHGDHYLGLIGLLMSLSLGKRTDDLYLFAPAALAEIITLQLKHSDTRLSYPLHFQAIEPDSHYQLFENEQLSVATIPLQHRVPCSGFLFKEKPRKRKIIKEILPAEMSIEQIKQLKDGEDVLTENGQLLYANELYTQPAPPVHTYAYCSDTNYNPSIVPIIRHANLLYHEATFSHSLKDWAAKTFHSTAQQAAEIAHQAQVGQLIIGHFSSRFKDVAPLLQEAQSVFPNTLLAEEGKTYLVQEGL